ncbi:WXG100 family type VII secretion target [Phytohabitans sp. LJ34]|uniref:WXG100 family type VII secretion target n=1 Tax=Phytohabitans sp. LJ34 TaxID=3452217 RepID=UPI003F8AE0A9
MTDIPITYNFGAIADVSTAIGTFCGNMDVELGDLYNDFKTLLAADWQGAAGQACDAAQQQWNQGADEIKGALMRLGTAVGGSAERMQEVDNRISAGF